MAVLVAIIGLAIFRTSSAFSLILFAFFCRGGLFSAWAMLSAALGELAPAVHRARAFALCEMLGGLAFSIGPMVAGVLYARRETLSFDIAIVLGLILLPILITVQRRGSELRRRALDAEWPEPEAPVAAAT
jgi:MFS family permease